MFEPPAQVQRGVYAIACDLTGWCYVGAAATSFDQRWGEHLDCLTIGDHRCVPLQKDWDRFRPTDFSFAVLQIIDSPLGGGYHYVNLQDILPAERTWIEHYKALGCSYNDYGRAEPMLEPRGVQFSVPEEIRNALDQWAEERKIRRSVLVREIIIAALVARKTGEVGREAAPPILTDEERDEEVSSCLDATRRLLSDWSESLSEFRDDPLFRKLPDYLELFADHMQMLRSAELKRQRRLSALEARLIKLSKAIEEL